MWKDDGVVSFGCYVFHRVLISTISNNISRILMYVD